MYRCGTLVAEPGAPLSADLDTNSYVANCRKQRADLDHSEAFKAQRATDALGALLYLFDDAQLPGADAAERLDFILWYTKGGLPFAHFRVDFTDTGFAEEFQDSRLWRDHTPMRGRDDRRADWTRW